MSSESEFLNLVETCDDSNDDWIDKISTIIEQAGKSRQRKLINSVSKNGFTPVHWACVNNNSALLCLLRKFKAELDKPTKIKILNFRVFKVIPKGTRPLHLAYMVNSPECANILLHSPTVDANARDAHGRTVAFIAASYHNVQVLRYLCENPNVKPNFDVPIVANTDAFVKGCTPLMAAAGGSGECTELLLQQFVDPNKIDMNGWTAAHYACRVGCHKAIEHLCEANINLKIQSTKATMTSKEGRIASMNGSTCLHILVKYCSFPRENFINCIEHLVRCGVSINAVNDSGWTASMIACMRSDFEFLGSLIESCRIDGKELDFSLQSWKKLTINAQLNDDRVWDEREIKDGVPTITFPKGSGAYDIAKAKDALECIELIMRADLLKNAVEEPGTPDSFSDTSTYKGSEPRRNSFVFGLAKSLGGTPTGSPIGSPRSGSPVGSPGSSPKVSPNITRRHVPKSASFDLKAGGNKMSSLQRYVVSKILLEDEFDKTGANSRGAGGDSEQLAQQMAELNTKIDQLKKSIQVSNHNIQDVTRELKEVNQDKKHAQKQMTRTQLAMEVKESEMKQEIERYKKENEKINQQLKRATFNRDIEKQKWLQESNKLKADINDLQYQIKRVKDDLFENHGDKDNQIGKIAVKSIPHSKSESTTTSTETIPAVHELHPRQPSDIRDPLLPADNTNDKENDDTTTKCCCTIS